MTHARTLSRYVGAAGLIAGLLVAVPSLAFASWSAQITDVRPTGNSTPTHIEARVSSNYRFSANDPRFYNRSLSLVSRQTVRTGALSALSIGRVYPGLALAVTAAGFVLSQSDIFKSANILDEYGVRDFYYDNLNNGYIYSVSDGIYNTGYYSSPVGVAQNYCNYLTNRQNSSITCNSYSMVENSNGTFSITFNSTFNNGGAPSVVTRTTNRASETQAEYNTWPENDFDGPLEQVTSEQDLQKLDQHLPDVLLREIYLSDTYPEPWYESLNVSSLPLSQVASPNGQAPPEIFADVAKWSENMTAQFNGDPEPYPGTNVAPGGNTAQDELLERLDEPVPDFAEVTPEWQVETIDELPAFDIGIGSGQCPPPTVVNLPFPFNTIIELSWQPICDFASMIRGAVIAVAMILSLYIVLRRV